MQLTMALSIAGALVSGLVAGNGRAALFTQLYGARSEPFSSFYWYFLVARLKSILLLLHIRTIKIYEISIDVFR